MHDDVDQKTRHAQFPDVGRPLVCVQRSAPSREASTKNQGLGHSPHPAPLLLEGSTDVARLRLVV